MSFQLREIAIKSQTVSLSTLTFLTVDCVTPCYSSQVAVPMRFNGRSGVEVRLPNDLEDLRGYTSLSLFLQRPDSRENGGTENMFVMYLGNKDVSISLVSISECFLRGVLLRLLTQLCHCY